MLGRLKPSWVGTAKQLIGDIVNAEESCVCQGCGCVDVLQGGKLVQLCAK